MSDEVIPEEVVPEVKVEAAVIDPVAHEAMKNDMFKYKRLADEANKAKEALEVKATAQKTDALKENEQYKTLWEQAEERATEAEAEAKSLATSFLDVERDRALETHLIKEGINPKFLPLIKSMDKSKLIVETTDLGRVNTLGLESWSTELKALYGEDMFPPEVAPTLNTKTETIPKVIVPGTKLTGAEALKLQREDPAGYETYMKSRMAGAS